MDQFYKKEKSEEIGQEQEWQKIKLARISEARKTIQNFGKCLFCPGIAYKNKTKNRWKISSF